VRNSEKIGKKRRQSEVKKVEIVEKKQEKDETLKKLLYKKHL
tara:strand:+ start:87 stop:212 length:126 start_codon:yes stop_codon:yes gene_type:complete